jgi:hypothetical protein
MAVGGKFHSSSAADETLSNEIIEGGIGRMRERRFTTNTCAAILISQLLLLACALRRPATFQVLPQTPNYLLRAPDRHETPLPDVLRDYNGFEPGKSWIELRPLMEVRIENAYYQQGSSRRGLAGFLGTEIARYQVRDDGLKLTSVQSMEERPRNDLPVQDLISAAVSHSRYYRLYYEIVFNRTTNSHGSVLLAANSREQMEQLSAQLDHPETVCGDGSTHCTAFPEACSVSVEMQIVVNGKTNSFVWGSLLSSVVGDHPQHLELRRLYARRLIPVEINLRDTDALRLPLLPGDHITWN